MPLEDHDHEETIDEIFTEMDTQGRNKILECFDEIREALSDAEDGSIPTDGITKTLVILEKNIGHNNIPPLLRHLGVNIDISTTSLHVSLGEMDTTLNRLKGLVREEPTLHTGEIGGIELIFSDIRGRITSTMDPDINMN